MALVRALPVFTSDGLLYVSKLSKPNHYNPSLDHSSSQEDPLPVFRIFLFFLQLHLCHMEVPSLGAELELQIQLMSQPWQHWI